MNPSAIPMSPELSARAYQKGGDPNLNAFQLAVEASGGVHDGTIVTGLRQVGDASAGVLRFEVATHELLESPDFHDFRIGTVVETANATRKVIVCLEGVCIEVDVKDLPA